MALLDIRTVFIICVSFLFIYGIGTIAFARKMSSSFNGLYLFAFACFLLVVGILLVFLRGYIDIFWSLIIGNAFIMLSANMTYQAHLRFINYEKKPILLSVFLLISAIILFAIFTYVIPDNNIRIALLSYFNSLQFFLTALTIYRHQKHNQQTIYTPLIVIASAYSVFFISWAVVALSSDPFPAYKLQGGWMHSTSIIVLMLYAAALNFCIVLISSEQLIQKITESANKDELTTLYNRRGLDHALQTKTILKKPLSVIMCDIDHFKLVNDRYGHPVGDQVIQLFAEIIKQSTRKTDICTRWGGEEFLIILPLTTEQEAWIVAEKIRLACEQQLFPDYPELVFTSSFGVCYKKDRYSFDKLINDADHALYQAKTQGRNRACVFNAELINA
jgi:diguanylate cyclase (GGDEF)-like protein